MPTQEQFVALQQRVTELEKTVAELKEQVSAQPGVVIGEIAKVFSRKGVADTSYGDSITGPKTREALNQMFNLENPGV